MSKSKPSGLSLFPLTEGEGGERLPEQLTPSPNINCVRNHTSTTLSSLSDNSSTVTSSTGTGGGRVEDGEEDEEDDEVTRAFLNVANGNEGREASPCSSNSPGQKPPMNGAASAGAPRRRAPDMQLGRCKWVRLFDNVTYIGAGIILREGELPRTNGNHNHSSSSSSNLEVLLIQEAKKKCYGKWYIPAGHMEPGETIEQGVKREVLEETGFDCSVDQLICTEIRGSGWYRFGFSCTITGGKLKTEPDRESLSANWHSLEEIKKRGGTLQLRCKDFFQMLDEAVRYHEWRKSIPNSIELLNQPLLNKNEAQPGLFIEFVIVNMGEGGGKKTECLVHGSIQEERQLLREGADPFPTVEFGFEFFFAMVVSKCYRHILEDGHQAIDLPSSVIGMYCLPAPLESLRQGLRLRILCRHKKAVNKAAICVPNRYHWLTLEDEEVLASLYLLPNQFRPPVYML